jgi:TRAP-type C4-dicarboxylate transport system permease small subunit
MARLDRGVERLLAVLMAVLVATVSWQVVARFVLGRPSSVSEEAARFLLIWLGLFGAGHALGRRMHLGIDLLVQRWAGGRKLLRFIALGSCLAVALGGFVIGRLSLVSISFELGQTSAALGWRLGYVYLALPLSGLLLAAHAVAGLVAGDED